MRFRKFVFLVSLFSSQLLFSQDGQNGKHNLYFRYQAIGNYKLADWETYANAYNASANPVGKLGGFSQVFNFDFGYRRMLGNFYTNISYQHYKGRATATFANKEERIFEMYANSYVWGFGYVFKKRTERLSLALFVNMNIRDKMRIVSQYQYADGYRSMGSDKGVNGTYMGQGLLGEELGLLLRYKLSNNITFEVETSKMWANVVTPSPVDDKSFYKAFATSGTNSTTDMTDKLTAYKLLVGLSFRL